MSMPISDVRFWAAAAALALLAACRSEPDNEVLAQAEADQARSAAVAGRVFCALGGAEAFRLDCTMDRIASPEGQIVVLGRADAGYRRFRVATDGRGLVAADGAEAATVSVVDNGMIEVAVSGDRYRLPATVRGGS